jgi:two-component system, response regulator YesN
MKILIVEDEFNAREGLANIIKKTCPQHEICGEAVDGEEGYRLALTHMPDLIFVDIELPKMNGLKMIEKLIDHQVNAAFVILSGYAEFEYAQQAIRYGVCEYLLKPITYDKLIHVLENIEKWKKAANNQQKKQIPTDELLLSILSDRNDAKEAMNLLKDVMTPQNLYLLSLYSNSEKQDDIEKIKTCLLAFCSSRKYKNTFFSFFSRQHIITVLINSEENQQNMERSLDYLLTYSLRQNGFSNITITLIPISSLDELSGKFDYITQLNEWGLTLGNQKVITKEKIPSQQEPFQDISNSIRQIEMEALAIIKSGAPLQLMELSQKLVSFLADKLYPPKEFKRVCAQYALSILVCFREFNMDAVERISGIQLFDKIQNCCTQKELLSCLNKLVASYNDALPAQAQTSSLIVKKTVNYIESSYADKVSLEKIASQLKVTPEYISHLFTKEMGISFSDYVKKYRIDMAKKIMQSSNWKIYQIGEKVGYRDPKYFNRVFKEVTGLSPKEYMKK